ncbi:MAG: glycosyltransferase family 4 protein [Candidatus Latescibacterota bacterium]|nr:MAG: glycosyltransferase family 4 protein [Candidatus Latescibacterota bacterium]
MSIEILADTRWIGPHGIGRFARETLQRLSDVTPLPQTMRLLHPFEPLWLGQLVRRLRPRVYFTPGFNPPLASPVPVVMTIYDLIHLRIPEESSLGKRIYYAQVVRRAARRGARVLTVSEFSKREILRWAGIDAGAVTVVGAGVDATFCPQGGRHAPGFAYLLYVGNRRPHKNFARLLQAFAAAAPQDVHLLVSGTSDAELEAAIRAPGLQGRVTCSGPIADADLPSYYRGARALLIPSLYEGFGLPGVEALACGTPVLAARAASLPEVLGDCALYVDPLQVESIASGIRTIVENKALRERLAAAGPERARLFRWDHVAQRVRGVIEEAANPEPSR